MAASTSSHMVRCVARQQFLELEGALEFSTTHERKCRAGEPDEPTRIR